MSIKEIFQANENDLFCHDLTLSGKLHMNGDLQASNGTFQAEKIEVTSTENSTNSTTGALTVSGGVGIGKDLFVSGTITAESLQFTDIVSDSVDINNEWYLIYTLSPTQKVNCIVRTPNNNIRNLIVDNGEYATNIVNFDNDIFPRFLVDRDNEIIKVFVRTYEQSFITTKYSDVSRTLIESGYGEVPNGYAIDHVFSFDTINNCSCQTQDVLYLSNNTENLSISSGALIVDGGASIKNKLTVGNQMNIHSTTNASKYNFILEDENLNLSIPPNYNWYCSCKTSADVDFSNQETVLRKDINGNVTFTGGFMVFDTSACEVEWFIDNNIDVGNTGCCNFKFKPNYSGFPSASIYLFQMFDSTNSEVNKLLLYHYTDGRIRLTVNDNTGTQLMNATIGSIWSAVSGEEYEFELNWSPTSTILFLDGEQYGSTITTDITTRGSGTEISVKNNSVPCAFRQITTYPTIQHTSSYGVKKINWTGLSVNTSNVNINSNSNATSTSTGALIVDGGISVKKDMYIEKNVTIKGNLTIDEETTANLISALDVNINSDTTSKFYNLEVASDNRLKVTSHPLYNWYCSCETSGNADYTEQSTTSPAIITGDITFTDGFMVMPNSSCQIKWLDIDGNVDGGNEGCINVRYKPEYDDAPSSSVYIFEMFYTADSNNNVILLYHHTSGFLKITVKNSSGTQLLNFNLGDDEFMPNSGQEYELELDWQTLPEPKLNLFINGEKKTGDINTDLSTRGIGGTILIKNNSVPCAFRQLNVFKTVQHTTDYGIQVAGWNMLSINDNLLQIHSNLNAIGLDYASFVTSGGASIIKDLRVGKDAYIVGDANVGGTMTCSELKVLNPAKPSALQVFMGILQVVSGVMSFVPELQGVSMVIDGALSITGALTKGAGSFVIPHPDLEKRNAGWKLRHCFVESNTRGDNLYRWRVTTQNLTAIINLPSYFSLLNENPMCFINAVKSFAMAYGDFEDNILTIHSNIESTFDVLVIGTRKDDIARQFFDQYECELPPNYVNK